MKSSKSTWKWQYEFTIGVGVYTALMVGTGVLIGNVLTLMAVNLINHGF